MDFTDTLVPLNSRFYSMLDMSDNIYQVVMAFSASIKPIMDLWDFDGNNNDIPTKEAIDSAVVKALRMDFILKYLLIPMIQVL